MHPKKILLSIFLCLILSGLCAQDLTGTWEGDLDSTEFIQVNIVHVKDRLCGYSWDYLYNNKKDFCKAYFTGRYDSKRDEWILTGTGFIANSTTHVLMRLTLSYHNKEGKAYLIGKESSASPFLSALSLFSKQNVFLRKVSNKPATMLSNMRDCLQEKKLPATIVKKPQPNSIPNKEKAAAIPELPVPEKPADNIVSLPIYDSMPIKQADNNPVSLQMAARKNTEAKHLIIHEKNITLEVYDNGIIDADTVSVFYNGKLLLSHQVLSEKPIIIPLTLNENSKMHEIVLFAENLGSIPPNTALVVVKAGKKRYELFASSSLTENAVIRFEYIPK